MVGGDGGRGERWEGDEPRGLYTPTRGARHVMFNTGGQQYSQSLCDGLCPPPCPTAQAEGATLLLLTHVQVIRGRPCWPHRKYSQVATYGNHRSGALASVAASLSASPLDQPRQHRPHTSNPTPQSDASSFSLTFRQVRSLASVVFASKLASEPTRMAPLPTPSFSAPSPSSTISAVTQGCAPVSSWLKLCPNDFAAVSESPHSSCRRVTIVADMNSHWQWASSSSCATSSGASHPLSVSSVFANEVS